MSQLLDIIRQNVDSEPRFEDLSSRLHQARTLKQLTLAALGLGLFVAVVVVEDILATRAEAPEQAGVCPDCGTRLVSKGFSDRRVINTIIGMVGWRRRLWRCPRGCKMGVFSSSGRLTGGVFSFVGESLTLLFVVSYRRKFGTFFSRCASLKINVDFRTIGGLAHVTAIGHYSSKCRQ